GTGGYVSGSVAYCVQQSTDLGTEIYLPFIKNSIDLGIMFVPFVVLVMISSVNAVNLTDGLDGLAPLISGLDSGIADEITTKSASSTLSSL
ncbi:unnamed protein product, partial [marine sediment metagenome]